MKTINKVKKKNSTSLGFGELPGWWPTYWESDTAQLHWDRNSQTVLYVISPSGSSSLSFTISLINWQT